MPDAIQIVFDGTAHEMGHVAVLPAADEPLNGLDLTIVRREVDFFVGDGFHGTKLTQG